MTDTIYGHRQSAGNKSIRWSFKGFAYCLQFPYFDTDIFVAYKQKEVAELQLFLLRRLPQSVN